MQFPSTSFDQTHHLQGFCYHWQKLGNETQLTIKNNSKVLDQKACFQWGSVYIAYLIDKLLTSTEDNRLVFFHI